MLGDRYRAARAHSELGRAYAMSQPSRAIEHLVARGKRFSRAGSKARSDPRRGVADQS